MSILGIMDYIEMEMNEDGVFVAARRLWVTTPDEGLCDVCTLDLKVHDEFTDSLAQVNRLLKTSPDIVAALADAARRIVEEATNEPSAV